MKNSNRKFLNQKWESFQEFSKDQLYSLCQREIPFTELTGFLFTSKKCKDIRYQKISGRMLYISMKKALVNAQN